MKKESSYQKLKRRHEELWETYCKAIARLKKLGYGPTEDDYLIGD